MKLKGNISIGRYTNSGDPDPVHIEIEDDLSSVTFISVRMTIEDFGKAFLGQGLIPCTFELRALNKVGKKIESKFELVELDYTNRKLSEEAIDSIIKPYEVDGWIAHRDDLSNWHNFDYKTKKCRVLFRRWVDVKQDSDRSEI